MRSEREEIKKIVDDLIMALREDLVSREFETFVDKKLCPYSFSVYCRRVCPSEEFCTLRESYELNFERVN